MNWILCGFKGCGKTYFASKIGLPYIDTDQLIEQKLGLTASQICVLNGYRSFRKLEENLLANLHVENHIIATGGGTLLHPESVSHLQNLGKLIFLHAPKALIRKRLLTPPLPTFIDPYDPNTSFEKMWSTRITEYEKICDFKVSLEGKSDDQVLEELWRIINLETSFESPHGGNPMAKQSES